MEATTIQDHRYDIFTSNLANVEVSDDYKRAIIIIPLMHVGANSKGLYWTASMLKKIAPLFKSVPFRYDLDGQEGSSHTLNKLSSPHFDVGWTYNSDEGAWYDEKTKAMWVKGEVTHPDVVQKLYRTTTDGKREVNFASMGVIVDEAKCSICGSDFEASACENGHERNKKYDGKTCYKIPTKVSRALHVALTNDPADGEAEIKNVLIQELTDYEASPQDKRKQAGEQMEKQELSNQIPGGLATSSPAMEKPGMAPSPEEILKDFAERIKTLEKKFSVQTEVEQQQTPELVNAAPQDQFVQSNMGTTTQFDKEQEQEDSKMDVKDAQNTQEKTPVNPTKPPEVSDMSQVITMLQQILKAVSGNEVADMGKESLDASKGMAKKSQEDIPLEHMGEGSVAPSDDEGNKKNKAAMTKPDRSEIADLEEIKKQLVEMADMKEQIKTLKSKLEIQDNNDVPEFGGNLSKREAVEAADMSALQRRETFGEYGAWDACFNGIESAERFKR